MVLVWSEIVTKAVQQTMEKLFHKVIKNLYKKGLIFVSDSNNHECINEARDELQTLLGFHELRQGLLLATGRCSSIQIVNLYKKFHAKIYIDIFHREGHPCIGGKPQMTRILCSDPYCMVSFLQWGANFIKYVQRNPEVSSNKSFVGIQLKRNWLNACHVRFPAM